VPRPLLLGHRGAPAELPENTLASFERALESGAEGVELDVQLSAEGVPVVIHDDTLDRTTDGTGPVEAQGVVELAALRAGGEPIPTLAEALRWGRERSAVLNVEIKHPRGAGPVVEVMRRSEGEPDVFLSSFHAVVLEELRELAPELPRFLLSEEWNFRVLAEARRLEVEGVCLGDAAATPRALEGLRAAGLGVVVWTVDSPQRLAALLPAGLKALITNLPAVAAGLRDAG
jgi:glycerophosphoryl diester phosphodiesterase